MEQIGGAIYWLGYFIALGLCCADLVFSYSNAFVKIMRFIFLPLLSWVYVGYFIGTSLNDISTGLKAFSQVVARAVKKPEEDQ